VPLLNDLAATSYDSQSAFSDVVHIVHINVIEPHPQAPDLSPYSGRVGESRYSTVEQPEIYQERAEIAEQLIPLIENNQLLLVDDLTPSGLNNPVWCTYGTSPNSAFLIGQNGIIQVSQLWLDVVEMEAAIRTLLGG